MAFIVLGIFSRIVGLMVNMIVSGVTLAVMLMFLSQRGFEAEVLCIAGVALVLFAVESYFGFAIVAAKKYPSFAFLRVLVATKVVWIFVATFLTWVLVTEPPALVVTEFPFTTAMVVFLLMFGNLPMFLTHLLELRDVRRARQ